MLQILYFTTYYYSCWKIFNLKEIFFPFFKKIDCVNSAMSQNNSNLLLFPFQHRCLCSYITVLESDAI